MAVSLACALAVCLEDARTGFRMCGFEPIQERGAKIETEVQVIVDDVIDSAAPIHDASESIRTIALGMNPFVPVVIWMRAVFAIDRTRPGVFARRLVEMGVNDDRAHAFLQGRLSPHLSMGQPEFFVEEPATIVRAGRRPVKRTTHRIRVLTGRARSARGVALRQIEGRAEWRKCD